MALRFKPVSDEEHFQAMAKGAAKSALEAEMSRLSTNRREEIARGKRPIGRPRKEAQIGDVLYDSTSTKSSVGSTPSLEGPGQASNSGKGDIMEYTIYLSNPDSDGTNTGSERSVGSKPPPEGGEHGQLAPPSGSTLPIPEPQGGHSVSTIPFVPAEPRPHFRPFQSFKGRVGKFGKRPSRYTNWFNQETWAPIEEALRLNRYKARQTVEYLNRKYPSTRNNPGLFSNLNESTVRGWINKDDRGLTRKVLGLILHMGLGDGTETSLVSMARREQGNIWSTVPHIEKEFRQLLENLRESGHIINSVTVSIMCKALMQARAPHLLADNGGTFRASRSWVRVYLATKMGWTFRDSTTNATSLPANWKDLGKSLAGRLAVAVKVHDIPPSLVVNMDQTGLALVPVSGERTYAKRGAKEVGVAKRDDKRSITVVPAVTASGSLLPFQVIFKGKSKNVLPICSDSVAATEQGWHFTYSSNHWSNFTTVQQWFDNIIRPYYARICAASNSMVFGRQKMVVILDCWSVHRSKDLRDWVQLHHPYILLIYIPAGTTSKLQPCDVIVQRPLKAGFTSLWTQWATEQAAARFKVGMPVTFSHLDLAISTLRCKAVEFLLQTWHALNARTGLLCKGWEHSGLQRAWDKDFQADPAFFEDTIITTVAIFDRLTMGNCDGTEEQPDRSVALGPWLGDTDALTVLEHCAGTTRMNIDINEDFEDSEAVDEGAWEEAYHAYLMDPLGNPHFPL